MEARPAREPAMNNPDGLNHRGTQARRNPAAFRRRGFTLLEAAMSTIIIGVGVLAVVEAQQSFLQRNSWSTNGATATLLAGEIREMTKRLPRHDRNSGGLFFLNDADTTSLRGWGPESGEAVALDLDDLDDLDGAVFGSATEFPEGFTMTSRYDGPINAFGQTITETTYDGNVLMLAEEPGDDPEPVAMRGWTQLVSVTKVDPYDYTAAVPDNRDLRDGNTILRRVDRYPLRVTVTILRQPDPNEAPQEMTTLSWVALP
jgi:hypothetical protein